MKFYHGTSYENAMEILRTGFGGYHQDAVWNCSFEAHTYAWLEDEDEDEQNYHRLHMAADNGQVAAAKYGSTHEEIVVFILEMPSEIADEWAFEDDTCPGMDGAYSFDSAWLNKSIGNGTVKMQAKSAKFYFPGFRWFYFVGLPMEHMDFSPREQEFIRIAEKGGYDIVLELRDCFYPDEYKSIDMKSMNMMETSGPPGWERSSGDERNSCRSVRC